MRVLFAASEVYPLLKTGGLGDVAHSLPDALVGIGVDVRLAVPGYREIMAQAEALRVLGWVHLAGGREARILEGRHPAISSPLWIVDLPDLFDRSGLPYTDQNGHSWHDNPARFIYFCEACAALALDALELDWSADVVHANDWQTGALPAFLALHASRPRTLFTIHNIAYDCQFDFGTFKALHLPAHWWSVDHGEFYDRFSMLKCGLVSSDLITTVSPRYAEEIRQPEFGYGYASILEQQAHKLSGIINGIDNATWDPQSDPHLVAHYHVGGSIGSAKRANRDALLRAMGAADDALAFDGPLIGSVGRMVYQKGIDLLLDIVPQMVTQSDARFAIIGSGEPGLEQQLRALTADYPGRVFHFIGYSETLAHQLEAGCDMFAMPSRYEPCGLNQMYSLRYGTPPIVRDTGGLADTVVDASPQNLADGTANGFVFADATAESLQQALLRALELFREPKQWMKLAKTGMRADFGWRNSAAQYLALYQQ
ncbi:MAG: glycogen synthase GlgA [Gammaproteobacteria bacterium]|nr:glycogen synthase GlgA [Gammaproteobacteria bacterium]